ELRLVAERFHRARLVGDVLGLAQRAQQHGVPEHLRRLRPPQAVARLGRGDALLVVRALQRVGDGNGEDSTDFVSPRLVDQAAQLGRTRQGRTASWTSIQSLGSTRLAAAMIPFSTLSRRLTPPQYSGASRAPKALQSCLRYSVSPGASTTKTISTSGVASRRAIE